MSFQIKDVIHLVGMEVKNHHGEILGVIKEVIVDEERQIPEYLILSCDDLFGNNRYFAIPAQPLLINIGKNNKITIPIEKDVLKVATGIHIDECPKFDPDISDSIFELLRYPDSSNAKRNVTDKSTLKSTVN